MPASSDDAPPRTKGRPVDPRLLKYGRASRPFFVMIGLIGFTQTLVIVAFAWLVTRAIVGALDGMPWSELSGILLALGGVVALRAVLIWAREMVAARASARVQVQLRAHLVEAIGTLGPGWLATHNSAQIALTAGRGLDALDAYFGRYLPQLVQTVVATPIIVLVMWSQDWISGLTVVLTLPLIPLFMVLIGLATRSVQNKQWRTLSTLAARFSDTVRGLSTLKVFGRQHRAVRSMETVTERYRVETMRVLRVSFLSGFALEFLASISVAIIAVAIGFRLIDGSLALTVGLFVLLLAPEAYLPIRQVGVQFHAAAEGVAATDDLFAVLDAARAVAPAASVLSPGEEIRRNEDRNAASAPRSGISPRVGTPETAPPAARGTLTLRDVRVQRGALLLEPVSFTADAGQIVLIEGPSGAGSRVSSPPSVAPRLSRAPRPSAAGRLALRRPGSRGPGSNPASSPAPSRTTSPSAPTTPIPR